MNAFELFNEQMEKFNGMLAENGLVGDFCAEKYPIEVEVKRNAVAAGQMRMFDNESEQTIYRETRIVLTFPVGAVGVHFVGKIAISEKTLNKIKSQAKKLHDLYLQGLFATLKADEDQE